MKQTRYLTKHAQRLVTREQYPSVERNPIRLISWATEGANLGGMVRLSEAFLVQRAYFLKTPARFTAVGTDRWQPVEVSWELHERALEAKAEGYALVAVEQTDGSGQMGHTPIPERVCFLIGNEGSGLPQSALDIADMAVEIEQYGMVGSLNVTTAVAIGLYEWTRQHGLTANSVWEAA